MSYSPYAYVEAFLDVKQASWIKAHIHMYEYFKGVARILVPDNCKTAVIHNDGWNDQQINAVYQEMAEHYGTSIISARFRSPKDKPNTEVTVGNISTWITTTLRNELFRHEELPLLTPLPATRYELANWKQATVQFNYHISIDGMLYSVPYEYIKKKVDIRVTDKTIEIFYNHNRIASHVRKYGRKGQYSTILEHMPEDHQKYLEWDGKRFRKLAMQIGDNTYKVIDSLLLPKQVNQQTYRSCMGLLKLADRYSVERLKSACKKTLSYTASPSYKSIKNILVASKDKLDFNEAETKQSTTSTKFGITRGADYYRR